MSWGTTSVLGGASHDAEDLRDEDEGVAAADAGLRDAAVAVAELGGDGQQEA